MRLGLRLSIHNQIGGGLDFSALTALPVERQSAVETAAEAAAATLGVSTQNIIDALGRADLWLDYNNAYEDAGTTLASIGDPVQKIDGYIAYDVNQVNSANQPTRASDAVTYDGVNDLLSSSTYPNYGSTETFYLLTTIKFNNTPDYFGVICGDEDGGAGLTGWAFRTGSVGSRGNVRFQWRNDAAAASIETSSSSLWNQVNQSLYIVSKVGDNSADWGIEVDFTNQMASKSGVATGAASTTPFSIGGRASTSDGYTNVDIGQIIITTNGNDVEKIKHFINEYQGLGL